MSTANYSDSMSDTAEKPVPPQPKSSTRVWTPALFAAVVVPNIVHGFIPWPWWTFWTPWWAGLALFGVYTWVRRRRTAHECRSPGRRVG